MTDPTALDSSATAQEVPYFEPAPGADPSPRPLSGCRVLVDTYNMRLQHGSGIKTYGHSLYETLDFLGGRMSVLTGRAASTARTPELAEVMLFDTAVPRTRVRRLVDRARRAGRAVTGAVTATAVAPDRVIPDDAMRLPGAIDRIYNAPGIYESANERFRRFRRLTRVRLPNAPRVWQATTVLPIRIPGARMVTTIHDLIPLRLPYTTLDDKAFFFHAVRMALRDSDLVLTISESTKRDIQRFFDVPDERIAVTYQALPTAATRHDEQLGRTAMRRYGLTSRRYVLFVGNIEPKKNVRRLLEAASAFPDDMPVVIVGRKAWLWREQLEPADRYFGAEADRRVRILGYVPRPVLSALYANATCLVFPSLYEGFGLPPLEAMRHGCPVICSNVASLPEVCADAALYVDPHEPDEIRHRVAELHADDSLRSALVRRGYARVEHFSIERYAQRLAEAYQRAGLVEESASGR